jgi:hypothetical protein
MKRNLDGESETVRKGRSMEENILELIKEKGPLTGSEILESTEADGLTLWRTCKGSSNLLICAIGTRYMRLDQRVEGLARLSPSILREFLTYSVIGLASDPVAAREKADKILLHIEEVSSAKSQLAYSIVSSMANRLEIEVPIQEQVCFILAGDIVYNMAHDVPRPERSTGKLVRGSDMDLVVIADEMFPPPLMSRLDDAIYQEKYRLLMTPHIREEVDYVVKNMERVQEQLAFDTFKRMVACKIMYEGTLLYGSDQIFHRVKSMLRDYGVTAKLQAMEKQALLFRNQAERRLLDEDSEKSEQNEAYLFYPVEESEEFE